MRYEHITLECIEGVATITINRPEVLNALSMQTLDEMMDALDSVAAMGARTLLLRGAGRAFCSGADLSGGVQEDPERIDRGRALETGFNPLLESMVRLPIPIVSAVSGAAAGGGCGIALAADIVIASRSAYFLLPFAAIGLVPDLGVTWLLPRLAGRARASAMMLLGERITADVAADWGLIYKVVDDDDLTTAATAMAARLAAGPTIALGLTRQALSAALNQSRITDRRRTLHPATPGAVMRDKEEIVRVALYAHRNGGTGVLSTGGSSIARISGAPRTWGGSLGVRF